MLPTETPPDPPIKIGVQVIEVKPDDAEQRLDRWLRRVFPQLTQGQIERCAERATPRGWRAGEIGNTPDRGTDDPRGVAPFGTSFQSALG